MDDRARLCKIYFDLGLSYLHILAMLSQVHGIVLSMSTLKRTLRKTRLSRRKNHADILDVALFIEDKLLSGAGHYGYRWMHLYCRKHGLNVPRDIVQGLLRIIDPIGVDLRLAHRLRRRKYNGKGPNFIWHIDSYDKLKRYGLCINGCIDGFSRRIMWLNVFTTSSDPKVIAGYYIETVQSRGGFPMFVRGDKGTENSQVAKIEFLSEKESFIYGRSTANQRIEMFCGFLRRQCCQFWMNSLGSLVDEALFDGYFIDKNILQYCFLDLLQADLDEMTNLWNAHMHIRPTKNQNCPHGRPMVMYSLPHMYNITNYIQDMDEGKLDVCMRDCIFRGISKYDEQIDELCRIYMDENNWQLPQNIDEGILLYKNLRYAFFNDLDL